MIRITELRLPISHAPEALEEAILKRLNIQAQDLIRTEVFKRSYDARKNVALAFIYTVDLSVKDEEKLLKKFGSVRGIAQAGETELTGLVSAEKAQALKKYLTT